MFIIETKGKLPIGMVGINNINYKNKEAEFGRFIIGNKQFRNKGYGCDAVRTLISFAFNKLGMGKIYLQMLNKYKKTKNLYKKIGFVEEVLNKKIIVNNRVIKDAIQMSIFR